MDEPTCARGVEVLVEITKKIKDLGDENDRCMAMIKDLENEIDSCMERVKHLQKGNDKHIEIVKCLEKENDIYRAREKFFYVCFVVVWVYNVVSCLCCTY
jgi:predicted nuclease with TOPRIM domain